MCIRDSIDEGEVRILMAGDTCQMAIHKKPLDGLSAVGGNSAYTYYKPDDPKYAGLVQKRYADIPTLLPCMGLEGAFVGPGLHKNSRARAQARSRRPSATSRTLRCSTSSTTS